MDIYTLLQNNIQSKIHKKKLYGSDCKMLSQKIYDETNRQISCSTIKRFFGLIKSNHLPSKYTLDTFAEFVGYKDWNDFNTIYGDLKLKDAEEGAWELLKKRMMQVTVSSLESLKQKTNYNKDTSLLRQPLKGRFQKLETSNVPATLYIAPDGYGKSTLLIQLVEKYFLQENDKFKNDIVCLIDGGIFFNLYSKNSNIDILNQLINFQLDSDNHFYLYKHPAERKGRIWLFIDDVDDVYPERKRYSQFIENLLRIMMIDEGDWLKVILTCRPENLGVFNCILHKKPFLKSFWLDVDFAYENYIDAINIPLFSTKEIKSLLKLHNTGSKYKDVFTRYKDILEIIANPYLFSLFINEFKQDENISEIILLKRFIKTEILSPPLLEQKLRLIRRYVTLCKQGQETTLVEKNHLLSEANTIPAYDQLISDGILYEYFFPIDTIDLKIMVSFKQKIIIDYIIFHSWTHDKCYSTQLFFEILEYYENNQMMQCSMMKFFVKMLIENNDLQLIEEINSKLHEYLAHAKGSKTNKSECMAFFIATLNELAENEVKLKNYPNI